MFSTTNSKMDHQSRNYGRIYNCMIFVGKLAIVVMLFALSNHSSSLKLRYCYIYLTQKVSLFSIGHS